MAVMSSFPAVSLRSSVVQKSMAFTHKSLNRDHAMSLAWYPCHRKDREAMIIALWDGREIILSLFVCLFFLSEICGAVSALGSICFGNLDHTKNENLANEWSYSEG